jgi:hypothetical protein
MTDPNWYRDIECLMTSNILTSVLLESDIDSILSSLRIQHRRLTREQQSGIQGNMEVDGIEAVKQSTDGKITIQELIKENIKVIKA